MEAKDTVMSWERIRMIHQECRDKGVEGLFVADKVCEVQAEISFKAGMQEVVEWVKANATVERGDYTVGLCYDDYYWIDYGSWLAKLKGVGIMTDVEWIIQEILEQDEQIKFLKSLGITFEVKDD